MIGAKAVDDTSFRLRPFRMPRRPITNPISRLPRLDAAGCPVTALVQPLRFKPHPVGDQDSTRFNSALSHLWLSDHPTLPTMSSSLYEDATPGEVKNAKVREPRVFRSPWISRLNDNLRVSISSRPILRTAKKCKFCSRSLRSFTAPTGPLASCRPSF